MLSKNNYVIEIKWINNGKDNHQLQYKGVFYLQLGQHHRYRPAQ